MLLFLPDAHISGVPTKSKLLSHWSLDRLLLLAFRFVRHVQTRSVLESPLLTVVWGPRWQGGPGGASTPRVRLRVLHILDGRSIPGLYSLDACSNPPQVVTAKNIFRGCRMSPGDKITLIQNSWTRGESQHVVNLLSFMEQQAYCWRRRGWRETSAKV